MRFDTSQHMKLGQHMKLAPRMIQSMEILQMPLADLQERIEQELENNPTLEIAEVEPESTEGAGPADALPASLDRPLDVDGDHAEADFERLDTYGESNPEAIENQFDSDAPAERSAPAEDYSSFQRNSGDGERDAKMDAMAAAPARAESLSEQLLGQWALADVDEHLKPAGRHIIAFLDDDGYLRTPLETILDRVPQDEKDSGAVSPALLEHALKAAQLFLEPAGVAARNAGECLLLQLDALEDEREELGWPAAAFSHARTIVEHHLDDLTQNRLPRVAEKTGLSIDQIKEALVLLKRLSLAPARRLVSEASRPIIPDAIVEYEPDEDKYIAYLNDSRIPNLRINQEYAKLTKSRDVVKKDKDFIRTNLSNAQWLMDAVNQRRRTLLRVVDVVVQKQREFFDFGPQALKPLPMTLVAEELGIHVATVSRAVAEKHLRTPRGIVPLRKFFSGGVQTKSDPAGAGGGEDMAWDAIKASLQDIIAAEDKAHPLSDEALVDELKKRGIEIARRTVAKYRDQLQIPPKRLRKTF